MLTQFINQHGNEISTTTFGYKFFADAEWTAYILQTPVAPAGTVSMNARVDAMSQPKTNHSTYFDDLRVYAVGD